MKQIMIGLFLILGCDNGSNSNIALSEFDEGSSLSNVFYSKLKWTSSLISGESTSSVEIQILNTDQSDLTTTSQLNEFHLSMPAMGHGTPEEDQKITDDGNNIYTVSGIHFMMAGDAGSWSAAVTATVDGRQDVAHITIQRPVE